MKKQVPQLQNIELHVILDIFRQLFLHIFHHQFENFAVNIYQLIYLQLRIILAMAEQQNGADQYEVIIVECCENCQTHQSFSRHSEWKYFQQFNQLKRKLERFVNNTIVVKNPIPDQLVKPVEARLPANTYMNKDTNQTVIFPRIGAFEVYIYNILIYSKLLTNNWPNHYKLIQLITKIIQEKKKGNNLQQFSVYRQTSSIEQKVEKVEKSNKQPAQITSKKKKKDYRVYKSKDKTFLNQSPVKKPQGLEPVTTTNKKQGRRTLLQKDRQSQDIRNSENKNEGRIKLPSLRNTINFKQQQEQDEQGLGQVSNETQNEKFRTSHRSKNRYSNQKILQEKQQSLKKIFNSIEEFQKSDLSVIHRKQSVDDNQFQSLVLDRNQSIDMKDKEEQEMKMLEDRSVQYSEVGPQKDFMNRSIQYQEDQGFHCDYGLQIDDGSLPKQKNSHYIQTDPIQLPQSQPPKKPYTLDQQTQANIPIPKFQSTSQTQTIQKQYNTTQTNTEMKVVINRGYQYPQQQIKPIPKDQFNVIDNSYTHLFQKRRNLVDNLWYSIDKFEEKSTRYKWVGRASQKGQVEELRKSFLLEALVFCFYNYFGIKTPEKRMSFQACSNVQIDQKTSKLSTTSLIHIMTIDNPQLQYITQFEQFEEQQTKYPLSEILTFKNSKQRIKFTNYGGLLALAYFIGDKQIYQKDRAEIGIVVSNQEVKEIYKMTADQYKMSSGKLGKGKIVVDREGEGKDGVILLERASQQVQMEFISTLAKIIDQQVFSEMLKYYEETFVHLSPSHKTFRNSLMSMKTEKIDNQIVESFIQMLQSRRDQIMQLYKGQIYSYRKYRSLQPKLTFSLQNFVKNQSQPTQLPASLSVPQFIERRFLYNQKIVSSSEIQKHIRSKDTFVIIHGQSGMGKTHFIDDIGKNLDLKYAEKLRIRNVTKDVLNDQVLLKRKVDEILDQYRKQVIILDDAQLYIMQTISFIQRLYSKEQTRTRPEVSFCLATCEQPTKLKLRLNALGIQVVFCSILPLQVEQIRNYMMKNIQFHNFTQKKNLLQQLLGNENSVFSDSHPKYPYLLLLRNPLYLRIYTEYLCHQQDLSDLKQCLLYSFNRYSLLKQVYGICWNRHLRECKQTQTTFLDCLQDLRKIAFQYYVNGCIMTEGVREVVKKYNNGAEIITNQLAFYPVNIEASVKKDKDLFFHKQYLYYFFTEAYCFYLQNSYRNLRPHLVYPNYPLLSLLKQHYTIQKTHSKLLTIIQKSRKYKNTYEQSSNAITLLNKIDYTFTNNNFDEVQIQQADLTAAVFYSCTFRGTNLNNTVLYRAQMINCMVDNAMMDNIGLYQRKYEIQYTVLTAALSVDGRNLALGCGNYLIILQTDTGKQLKKIQAHVDIIRSVKYSKDNNTLITIADDKTLRMWDTRSYRSVVFKLPQKGTIAFSSETDMIASVSKSTLKVWNIKSMAGEFVLEGHSDLITCLQFSQDGNNIVTGSRDTTVRIWSTKKGELVKTFKGHPAEIVALKISPLKKAIVSSSKDKDIVVWGFDTAAEISKKKFPDQITQICLDEKEKFIVVALSKQNYISILHVETLEVVHVLQGHRGRIISLNFDTNFRRLISLGRDKTVRIWDFDRITETQEKKYLETKKKNLKIAKGSILSMAYDKITHRYLTSHQNGQINIFSAADNRHIDQLISHNGPVNCVQVDKSSKIYAAGSDGSIRIWNLAARRQPKSLDLHSSPVIQLKLNEKNRIIATSSMTQELVIADFTGIKIVMSTRQEGKVQSIEFSKDEKIMAVGGSQKYIAIYQVTDGGNSINRMEELGPNSQVVTCMAFHGQTYLVAALKNGHVAIWNHLRATLSKKIENTTLVTSLLSFQKKYVCFSSQDGKLRVVDMDEGKQIKIFRLNQKCTNIVANANQTLLYESTSEGNIAIWNLRSLKQRLEKVEFDRIAYDQEGLKLVQIEGPRDLLIKDLHFHEEEYLKVEEINYDIEGVTFYRGKIILLLKNGIHWELGKRQFNFGSEMEAEGDLYWLRDREATTFFKTAVKKLKGIKKPILSVLEQISS